MRYFETILEAALKTKTYYRGVNDEGLAKLKRTNIPGYVGELGLAMIYAQPSLTGSVDDTRYLISIQIDQSQIKDMSKKIPDMSTWSKKGKMGYLKNEIWTAYGSGHGDYEAIYCGKPVKWKLIKTFNGDKEWRKTYESMRKRGKITSNDDDWNAPISIDEQNAITWKFYVQAGRRCAKNIKEVEDFLKVEGITGEIYDYLHDWWERQIKSKQ
jgi:hypothetical protein